MKISRAWAIPSLFAAAAFCAAQTPPPTSAPTTRPKFTIGKDTTLIDGPLNPDGTINYVAAINKLLGEGVTNENNAAIPLLSIQTNPVGDAESAAALAALHATPLRDPTHLEDLEFYLAHKNHFANPAAAPADEQERDFALDTLVKGHPWRAAEHPEAAEWLNQGAAALEVVANAARLPHYYVPFASNQSPPTTFGGLPLFSPSYLMARDALESRAMLRAGEGNVDGALADLRTSRKLARLLDQEHLELHHLMANAAEYDVLRAYAVIATANPLPQATLERVAKEITAQSPMPESDPTTERVEAMRALDQIMQCIRGDSQSAVKIQAELFAPDLTGPGVIKPAAKDLDLGDLSDVDWNVALEEAVRLGSISSFPPGDTYAGRIRALDDEIEHARKLLPDDTADGTLPIADGDEKTRSNVEHFLKRRTGETVTDYSRRVATWLSGWDPADEKGFLFVLERCRLMRSMALLSVALAEYRDAHGAYPDSLKAIAGPTVLDPFSGKDVLYAGGKDSFNLWSVGRNGNDDGGKGDDIVIHAGP